jgi:hypothetical protein
MADITIAQVREKYPQYSDLSDTQLADALHAKFYSDMDKGQFYAKIGLNKDETYITSPEQSDEPGFLSKVGDSIVKRAGNVDTWRAPVVLGQAAGAVNDTAVAALESLYGFLPEEARAKVKSIVADAMKTSAGQAVAGAVEKGAEKYQEFKGKNPELAKDIEGYANIAGAIPVTRGATVAGSAAKEGAKIVGKEGAAIVGDVGRMLVPPVQGALDQEMKSIVKRGVVKGFRPTVVGKDTAPKVANYYARATDAVKTIVENKGNLRIVDAAGQVGPKLPETLSETSQAISQSKKLIFKQYDDMRVAAGQGNAVVDLSDLVTELEKVANDKVIVQNAPEVASYAQAKAKAMKGSAYTPAEAQDAIQMYNSKLEAFYKNPDYSNAAKTALDDRIARYMRTKLDELIESEVGPGYQDLKNKYGSLKAIEKEVNHRMIVEERKNPMGFFDGLNAFTGYEAIRGVLTMKPEVLMAAVGAKGIQNWMKKLNNPDKYIKEMFIGVDRNLTKQELLRQGNPAQSWTMQQLGL